MARLLFVALDAGGNVPPVLDVAAEAADRGHEVHVLGHERLRDRVRRRGLSLDAFAGTRPWDAGREQSVLRWAPMLNDARIGEEVRRVCARWGPDVVVVDCMAVTAHAAVDDLGIPRVVLTHTYKGYYDRQYLVTSGVLSLLAGHNLARLWATAALDLVCCSRELDPAARRRHADNVRWVGVVDRESPREVDPGEPPLVLVSMSTNGFRGQRRTLRRVIAALGELPVRAVVTTGGVIDPDDLLADSPAPDNVHVTGYADHAEIMDRSALVITHGGHSTAFRALARGIPLVVVAASLMTDQRLVGRSLADAGAAVRMSRATATTARLRAAVTTVLDDPGHRAAAGRIGRRLRSCDAAGAAVQAVEGVLGR